MAMTERVQVLYLRPDPHDLDFVSGAGGRYGDNSGRCLGWAWPCSLSALLMHADTGCQTLARGDSNRLTIWTQFAERVADRL